MSAVDSVLSFVFFDLVVETEELLVLIGICLDDILLDAIRQVATILQILPITVRL